MVFLAAVHDELLRDPGRTSWPPTTRPSAAAGAGRRAARRARALLRRRAAERLEATLATRRTQTNETARCAGLLPAFAAVAGGRPLAQIEIGASAGLNGLWDHYAYDYAGPRARGTPARRCGSPARCAGPACRRSTRRP